MTNTGRPAAPPMTNPRADRVKEVARLAGRPARLRQGRFLAEGPQSVREALSLHSARHAAGELAVIEELFITEECLDRHAELGLFEGQPAPRLVSEEVLAAMSSTVTPQGVIAVCAFVDVSLDAVLADEPRLVAVMVEVRDPGNAGTILRAADSAGADAVVLTSSSVDLYNPKAVRSTVGSLFHLPVVIGADLEVALSSLRERGITVLAADGYGDVDLDTLQEGSARRRLAPATADQGSADQGSTAAQLEAPTAWLFGNEAQGLPDAVLRGADHRVAVPIYGRAESLNVGTAATVCLYASARAQRLS
ncbi:RNA methyltransferase [Arthrobacter sp. H20]|uniref:TrmH family RNA methyltransferase n=1 Tax=Arthrobacter sp. H20 TaxID=1267981 RepID=UPI0004799411|nr:RNA methyltransferase [Arthrobacter sp. H20]